MRINEVGAKTVSGLAFKSLRTDRHAIAQLANGEKPIIENNKRNILTALQNLSNYHDSENIAFLLDVADNLAYGQGKNSEFKDKLDAEHITPETRENTDWLQILDDTVRKAISDSEDEDVTTYIDEYKRIFSEKKELTPEQKELLDLRKDLTVAVLSKTSVDDPETLEHAANIRQNLDYFVASSEISIKQKKEVLEKLNYFLSDEYQIVPQLKDKKLQAADEILNDLVVKTPNDPTLKTKDINQRQSGICAAISICRKAMAYEDKVKFTDLIMEELKDSPTMSVYDVTELSEGKKIEIPKANINYNNALAKGYRIIDASAHIWMNNAHAVGNGGIQTEHYIAFDEENYGIFDDSGWLTTEDEGAHSGEKGLLRALIKEKEYIDSYFKTKKAMSETYSNISDIRSEAISAQTLAVGKLNTIFSEVFPERKPVENTVLIKSMFKFYTKTNDDNERLVSEKLPDEVKTQMLEDFILKSSPDMTDEQKQKLHSQINPIFNMTEEYTEADKKLAKAKRFSLPKNKYILNKKLFNIASAHRTAIERDVNLQDGVARFERLYGLPPRDIQIIDYLNSLKSGLDSYEVRKQFANKDGAVPSKKQLEASLNADIVKLGIQIPKKLNEIAQTLYDKDLATSVRLMFEYQSKAIKDGDKEALENVKMTMNIKGDKNTVTEKLDKWAEKLSGDYTQEDLLEAVRMLGYDDRMHISSVFLISFFQNIQNGIPQEDFERLVKIFGGEDKIAKGFEIQNKKFNKIKKEYNSILEKWKVPTAREAIINKMEKEHDILSQKQLDALNEHFMTILAGRKKNESIKSTKDRDKANNGLYKFTEAENELFRSIEKKMHQIRKFCNMEYDNLNSLMRDELEAQYSNAGMLNGQFWVREEGSSGLYANEQIRILEQMTGKPYHMVTDINDASKEIQKGKGSGILAMSVADSDYAFHAQYVPEVTSETVTNPVNGEKLVQQIIWTDNSWGNSEKEYFWNGHDGFYHTDYGNGYGLKHGFMLSDDGKIGLPVSSIHGALGVAKEDDDEKFGLFNDVILPGSPVDVYQKLYKMFDYVLHIDEGEQEFASLEKRLSKGYKFSIKEADGFDDIMEAKFNRIAKFVEDNINSEEDFDKLPEDNEVKMAFKQLAVYMSTDNPQLQNMAIYAHSNEELKEVSDTIYADHVNAIATILAKTGDVFDLIHSYSLEPLSNLLDETEKKFGNKYDKEKFLNAIFNNKKAISKYNGSINDAETIAINRLVEVSADTMNSKEEADYFIPEAKKIISDAIKNNIFVQSLNSPVLSTSPLYSQLIASVDKYLEPKSDAEMLRLIQELQVSTKKQSNSFFKALEPEDVGIRIKKPYDYLLRYKAGNSALYKALSEIVYNNEIYENLYRGLSLKLSEMDVQKYIKAFKAEAFQKYKVRQAFPEPVVIPDKDLDKSVKEMMANLREHVDGIYSSNVTIKVLDNYKKLQDNFLCNPDFMALYMDFVYDEKTDSTFGVLKEDIRLNDENSAQFKAFIETLLSIYDFSSQDASYKKVTEGIDNIFNMFEKGGVLSGKVIFENLNQITSEFNQLKDAGITRAQFEKMKKADKEVMDKKIRLMVNANIEPKYRDEAFKRINTVINMYKKDYPEDVINEEIEYLSGFFIHRHIVKNPTELLREVTKLLMDGKKDTDLYRVLKEYLISALKVAQQTKIQYKLVQNQHEGLSSKTKDILPLFSVTLHDGTKQPMESETGMLYIMKQLENAGDNNKILNLFLSQSGLTDKALTAIMNHFEIEKTTDIVDEKVKEMKEDIAELDRLADLVADFRKADTVPHKDIKEALEALTSFVKKQIKNHDDIPAVKQFLTYIESLQYTGNIEKSTQEVINSLTGSISLDALQSVADSVNETMMFINETMKFLQEQIKIVVSINVQKDSETYNRRTEFLKRYEKVLEHVNNKVLEYSECVKSCKFLSGHTEVVAE